MTKKLWGGRFQKKTDPLVEEFTRSIQYDARLAKWDCLGSLAHVQVLKKAKYLTAQEAARLSKALTALLKGIESGTFTPDARVEDIHSDIQNRVTRIVGELGHKLHTARSRNDQVAFATKLYCSAALQDTMQQVHLCADALKKLAAKNKDVIIPGFTHLQHAQPVLVADFLGAYAAMLGRDAVRLRQTLDNLTFVFGAGALAGTPIPSGCYTVSVHGTSVSMRATANSLDTVSDRDFVIEIISALSVLATHLSRLAEDLVIWATKEYDFIELDDAYCTGSSLMPQKKNPDVLELIRGYAGRVYGNLMSVLTMMKGLPLSYNRDMQLDKEPLFQSFDIVQGELKVVTGLIKTLKFKKETIARHLKDEFLYATDLVYYLVDKKVSFQEAHTIVGKLVKYSLKSKTGMASMTQDVLNKFSPKLIKSGIIRLFDPAVSVKSKRSIKRNK